MKFGNKSLYLYTGLIFFVALIIIIVTFFGQDRILRETNEQIETATAGITERAAILSDENMQLTEKINDLNNQLTEANQARKDSDEKTKQHEKLFLCYSLVFTGDFTGAKNTIDTIDTSVISENALIVYNELNTAINTQLALQQTQTPETPSEVQPAE